MLASASHVDGHQHPALWPNSYEATDRLTIDHRTRVVTHRKNPYTPGQWSDIHFAVSDRLTDRFAIHRTKKALIHRMISESGIKLNEWLTIDDVLAYVYHARQLKQKAAKKPTIDAQHSRIALCASIPSPEKRDALRPITFSCKLYSIVDKELSKDYDGMDMIWIQTKAILMKIGDERNRDQSAKYKALLTQTMNLVKDSLKRSTVAIVSILGTWSALTDVKKVMKENAPRLKYRITLPKFVCVCVCNLSPPSPLSLLSRFPIWHLPAGSCLFGAP